jgi:hypothetical protein
MVLDLHRKTLVLGIVPLKLSTVWMRELPEFAAAPELNISATVYGTKSKFEIRLKPIAPLDSASEQRRPTLQLG